MGEVLGIPTGGLRQGVHIVYTLASGFWLVFCELPEETGGDKS